MGSSRQEYWSGLPCPPPGDLPHPGVESSSPVSPALQTDSLPLNQQGSPVRQRLSPFRSFTRLLFAPLHKGLWDVCQFAFCSSCEWRIVRSASGGSTHSSAGTWTGLPGMCRSPSWVGWSAGSSRRHLWSRRPWSWEPCLSSPRPLLSTCTLRKSAPCHPGRREGLIFLWAAEGLRALGAVPQGLPIPGPQWTSPRPS